MGPEAAWLWGFFLPCRSAPRVPCLFRHAHASFCRVARRIYAARSLFCCHSHTYGAYGLGCGLRPCRLVGHEGAHACSSALDQCRRGRPVYRGRSVLPVLLMPSGCRFFRCQRVWLPSKLMFTCSKPMAFSICVNCLLALSCAFSIFSFVRHLAFIFA